MTVFTAASQSFPDRVTYALRTAGDPLRYVRSVQEIVREADSHIPVTNVVTQAAEIDSDDQPGSHVRETMSVTRQAGEIGTRMALGRNAAPWYGWFGSAPRSATGGGGTRDQRACRVNRVPACQIASVRDPAQ